MYINSIPKVEIIKITGQMEMLPENTILDKDGNLHPLVSKMIDDAIAKALTIPGV